MMHTIKLIWGIESDPCLFLGGAPSAECSQRRPTGSGTDGEPNMGLFCLIVDVTFLFFIREDLWHIWSRERLHNSALQERTRLVSLFKCLKWIFRRSAFPYTLDPGPPDPTPSQNYASRGIFRYHLPLTLWWKQGPLRVGCFRAVPSCTVSIS